MKHLVVPDPHAHYQHNNLRALWLGELINDIKPDRVIVLGDVADMPSLSSYDKGKRAFQGRTYSQDMQAHGDFQEKLWSTVRRAKRKLPHSVVLHGNHEQRIERAIEVQAELEGVISYEDLELDHWYDEVVPYTGATPGSIALDGVHYAHYFVAGISGRPISGEHSAYSLLSKLHASCVVGHSHLMDHCVRTRADGQKIMGLVAGCYQDWEAGFAGEANKLWWRGVCVLNNVEDGCYDLQTISLESLRKEYGSRK